MARVEGTYRGVTMHGMNAVSKEMAESGIIVITFSVLPSARTHSLVLSPSYSALSASYRSSVRQLLSESASPFLFSIPRRPLQLSLFAVS